MDESKLEALEKLHLIFTTYVSVVVPKPSAKWLKFNYKQVGYYRVNYENWDELVDNVHEMSIADKTHLLEETFSLAASGQINYEIPLNFVKYLETEDNYVPWNVASSKLKNIKNHLSNSDVLSEFQVYHIGAVF